MTRRGATAGAAWSLAVGASFAARGMHSVLLPWLLAVPHAAGGTAIGWVQGGAMATQAASLLVLGGLGDRFGARRVAGLGQAAAALPPLLLCLRGGAGGLADVLVYALVSGGLWGALSPARDALVARRADGDLLRPTAGLTLAQFSGLLAGIALASAAEAAGVARLLAAQSLLHGSAALALARSRGPRGPAPAARRARTRLPRGPQREVVLLTALLGLFAAGPFAVWVPLRASSESASPARAIGLLMALFPLGTIVGSLALRFMPASLPRRPALLAAHAAGSLCIAGAGLAPTLGLGAALLALWGACGAVFISCGRAFLLEASPPEEHGRRLADLQLALLLASPLGALLAGVSAGWVGARASMVLLGAAALLGAGTLALAGGARGREPLRLLGVRDAP